MTNRSLFWSAVTCHRFSSCDLSQPHLQKISYIPKLRGVESPRTKAVTGHRTPKKVVGLRARETVWRRNWLGAGGLNPGARGGGGQSYAEGRAATGSTLNADVTGVFLHDAVRGSKPETGAASFAFGRVERVIDLGYIFRGDPDAVIGNLNHEGIVATRCSLQGDAAAIRNRIARVQQQVRKDLLQLAGITDNARCVEFVTSRDLDLIAPQLRFNQLDRVIQHPVQIELGEFGRASGSREVEQVVDDVGSSIGLPADLLQ